MSKGFENGRVVPVVHGNVGSKWATMPNQETCQTCGLDVILVIC